jgi:hypothetical protein
MPLVRTRVAFELIQTDVTANKPDKFIQSCLAQHLAVTFYAEMEERVAEIISTHLKRFTGSRIGQFLTANLDQMIGRVPKSDISKLLGLLGEDFKAKFNDQIPERDVSMYSNIIQARHSIGHKNGSEIAMSEILLGIDAADKILTALDNCFHE